MRYGGSVQSGGPEMDAGPLHGQAAVSGLDDDRAERLGRRGLAQEHVIYPLARRLAASGAGRIVEGRVFGAGGKPGALVAPAL